MLARPAPLARYSLYTIIIQPPCASLHAQQVDKVTKLDAAASTPFVGEALRQLRTYIGNEVSMRCTALLSCMN